MFKLAIERTFAAGVLAVATAVSAPALAAEEDEMSKEKAMEHMREIARECMQPEAPEVPDGANADQEAMLSAQQDVQSFVADSQTYLKCLEEHEASFGDEISEERQAVIVAVYNAAVDKMKTVGEDFNEQVRAYNEQ